MRSALTGKPVGVSSGGMGHEYTYLPQTSLWFTDDNTIAMTIVTGAPRTAPSPTLSQENEPNESWPLRLDAVFLDATSGKVKAVANWPASSTYSKMIAVDNGKFVTESGNQLTLYARDLTEVRRVQLPSAPLGGDWLASPSPSGKNVLLVASNLRTHGPVGWIWVDTDSLRIVRSWEEVQSGWVGISDHEIAMTTCVWFFNCRPMIEVRGLSTGWEEIASTGRYFSRQFGWGFTKPHPQFIADDVLALEAHKLRVFRRGEVVRDEDIPYETCGWGGVYPAADGSRFVIPSCKYKRGSELFGGERDDLKRIFVYDAPFEGQPRGLDFKGPGAAKSFYVFIALSPDGSRLAVLQGLTVWVYQLPEEQASGHRPPPD